MTIKSFDEIECPRCGVKTQTQVWNTLNSGVDPEDKILLMEGMVNRFKCSACGFEAWLKVQLLFHEMGQHPYVAYLFPQENIDDLEFLNSFSKDGRYHVDPGFDTSDIPSYFKNPHYVFGMEELINYVRLRDKLSAQKRKAKKDIKGSRVNKAMQNMKSGSIESDTQLYDPKKEEALEKAIKVIEKRFGKPKKKS